MANQSVRLTNASVVAALNNKADIELENSSKAAAIESLANSAATTASAASKVADAAVDLIEVQLPLKVNKSGDTFNGNVVIDGNLTVTGDVNIPADGISGSVEVATSATKDSNGNVIVDTYAKKTDLTNMPSFSVQAQDSILEGGSIEFIGAGSYNSSKAIIDRGENRIRIHNNTKELFTVDVVSEVSEFKCSSGLYSSMSGDHAQFIAKSDNYGFMLRNDDKDTWFLLTNEGDPYGTWATPQYGHPIRVNNSTGQVYINGGIPVSTTYVGLDGNNYIRKYSDGWIEQGGWASFSIGVNGGYEATVYINFNTPFASWPRNILINVLGTGMLSCGSYNWSTSGFTAVALAYSQWREWTGVQWHACGY